VLGALLATGSATDRAWCDNSSFEEGPSGQQGYKIIAIENVKEIGRGDQELKCVGNALVSTGLNNTNTVDIHYRYTIHDGQLSVEWSTEPWWE